MLVNVNSAVVKMSDWTGEIVDPLTDEQCQKMLKCEYGGMNDVLANIYAITGNKKYLDLSYKFYDDFAKPIYHYTMHAHSNSSVLHWVAMKTNAL